jgi:hypothetical protein
MLTSTSARCSTSCVPLRRSRPHARGTLRGRHDRPHPSCASLTSTPGSPPRPWREQPARPRRLRPALCPRARARRPLRSQGAALCRPLAQPKASISSVGASCGSGARSCASLHRDDSGRPKKSALGGEFVGTAGTPSSPLIACSRTSCKRCSIRSIARASGGPRTAPRSKAAATGGDQERTGRSPDALKLLSAFLVNFVRQLGRLTSDRPGDAIGKDLENTAAVSTPWRGWRGRAAVAWVALWVNPGKRRKTLRNQWRVAEKDPLPPALRPRKPSARR